MYIVFESEWIVKLRLNKAYMFKKGQNIRVKLCANLNNLIFKIIKKH